MKLSSKGFSSSRSLRLTFFLTIMLVGCGGGSDNSQSSADDDFTPVVTKTGIITLDQDSSLAQPHELILYYPNDTLSNIEWQQTAGHEVVFHAKHSKVIAFTPSQAGDYSFQVSFTRNGVNENLSHTLSVAEQVNQLSVRLGHAALEGSKVSLRAYLDNAELISDSITWQQTSGPKVTFSETSTGKESVFFTAPDVSADSIISFTVSASNGSQAYQDTVALLIESADPITSGDNTAYPSRLAKVFPYHANSPYADVLVDCVYSNRITFDNSCRFNELPLIAQDTTTPSVNDIMDRVLVSHHWMGQRFAEFLQNADQNNDFKNLLRATTAIVISYDIRPSYYWAVTGAIHLDANNLWLTPDERDTINQAPDFRSNFGESLNFVMPWRYVKNNQYSTNHYPEQLRLTRDADDLVYQLAALMYHELAHANDYFPASVWHSINRNERILDNVNQRLAMSGIESDKLSSALPLHGEEMYRLAQVRFHGEAATENEKNYTPSDVALFFSPEHAPHFYNYSSKREDYAMLFDALMMKARYDVDRDIAVTNKPQSSGEDYIVTWGQRGRIGEQHIKPRVEYVTRRILPEFTYAASIINNLPEPIAMKVGSSWTQNLGISPSLDTENMANINARKLTINSVDAGKLNSNQVIFYEKPMPERQ
ncbi:hypothetical protein SAMN05216262_10546 [Colwellia chukchiensis]|uniref:Lipoprotein n=1 Tax=Colwellia chukchiensis TaxID=641665 RepID=A0A1H7M1N0_9GAMM|nr:hypothetical protein [Colwellia chukchiensis]SEL04507.1 hypothetical protein SAMN05216262_10546 [Colwellia chukchiensis]